MDRRQTTLWMREVLDHLNRSCDQWQAGDGRADSFALESIERDLAELQRACRAARLQNELATGASHVARAA